jgi:hypothetical protein
VSEWAAHCPTCGADLASAAPVGPGASATGPASTGERAPTGGLPTTGELEAVDPLKPDEARESEVTAMTVGHGLGSRSAPKPPGSRRGRVPTGALAVALVVAGGALLVVLGRHGHPVASPRPSPTTTATGATPTSVGGATLPTVPSAGPGTTLTTSAPPAVRLVDLTWISDSRGFALVSVNCPTGTCALILTTSDGGQSWTRAGNLPDVSSSIAAQVCITACFEHLRYASPAVGYLWGQGGLYLTVDGGQNWVPQPTSQIAALEAVPPGWAVRVAAPAGASGPLEVDRAPVGSGQWAHVPTQVGFNGAEIFTAGKNLYIAWGGQPAGGSTDAHTSFIRSVDGGTTWQSFGDPCGRTSDGSELDASVYAATPNGDLAVLCRPRLVTGTLWFTESLDSGDHFGPLQPVPVESDVTVQLALADSGRVALVATTGAGSTQVIRSADGGQSWADVLSAPSPANQSATPWLGFEDETTGRVSFGDTLLWTTTDSGLTWTEEQVPASV